MTLTNEQTEQTAAAPTAPADLTSPDTTADFPVLKADASPEEVLAFNPFAKKTTGEVAPQDGGKVETQTQAVTTAESVSNPTALLNKPDPHMDAIRAILTSQELGASNDQDAGQYQETESVNDFSVNWAVPEPMVEALMSQEPQQVHTAVSHLINGVANGVLQMVQERFNEFASRGVPDILSQREQVQQLNSKFYGKYPYLQKPELVQTVAKVAGAVARQQKSAGVNVDPLSDSFMAQVENYMVANGYVTRPAGKTQAKSKTPPAHFGNTNARPPLAVRPTEDLLNSIGL